MKARVKATGEIVEIEEWSRVYDSSCNEHELRDLTILEDDTSFDSIYWTRLEHQYAGMAMQGLISDSATLFELGNTKGMSVEEAIAAAACKIAHALVEKLKSERK